MQASKKKTCIYLFVCAGSQLQHVGSSSLTGTECGPPALGAESLSHWTTGEVPVQAFYIAIHPFPGNTPSHGHKLENHILHDPFLTTEMRKQVSIWPRPGQIKSASVSIVSPSVCYEVMGLNAMIFIFWMLSFKPAFSSSSFTFIKRLFSSSLVSAVSVVHFWGYWYFSWQSWFQLVFHPARHFTWCI